MVNFMEGEICKLIYENFKVMVFQIFFEVKCGNVIFKLSCVCCIVVSFDLVNVLVEYQGLCLIYMVIIDEKGILIFCIDYIMIIVNVNGQLQDLMVVEVCEENIGVSQWLEFVYELENKLDVGYYCVSVYIDIGLLGLFNFCLW